MSDVVARGFEFSNSEVGFKSVTGMSYLEVLRCTNGMTNSQAKDLFSNQHSKNNRFSENIANLINRAPKVWDAIEAKYTNALTVSLTKTPEELINSVCADYDIGQRVSKELYNLFLTTPLIAAKDTWQGICDTFTEFAHTKYDMNSPSYTKMELVGTKLLDKHGKYLNNN